MEKSVDKLVSQLTLEEKISMVTGADWWHTVSIERLGIPAIRMTDGPHGVRTADDFNQVLSRPAACFPTGVSMAATWNTDLIYRVGQALGEETKARGCHILLGPCVNIHRSPLAGRNFESFSEDPYLAARMAVAHIRGVQSRGVGTSVKHFALNNSEFERFTISSEAGERTIREIYLPAFQAAVKEAEPWTVMSSYNKVNGTWASENRYLLTDILKKEWGFEGFVVSDWFAFGSTVGSALAGLDLEMPGPSRFFGKALLKAVRQGLVGEEIIDDKIRRILKIVAKSGADKPSDKMVHEESDTPALRKLAREAADEAIILLKNQGGVLPLDKSRLKSLAVIGPNAAIASIEGDGSSKVRPYYAVTPLEGLKNFCGDSIRIHYEPGCRHNILTPLLAPEHLTAGPDDARQGLEVTYYNNNDLAGAPAFRGVDCFFAFRWGEPAREVPPAPGVNETVFSIRWSGMFTAPVTGDYIFSLMTDGLGRVIIDDRVVVDKWAEENIPGENPFTGERTGSYYLEAGRRCRITIEYRQKKQPLSPVKRLRLGCQIPIGTDAPDRAVAAAANADAALVFAGLTDEYDTEGADRKDMRLPGDQEDLIRAVAKVNKNTVVVLTNGSPLDMASWIDDVPGVVEAYYLGQECGHAIAGVLFGEVNPSGKLPETFPRRLEDNPAYINYPGENGQALYGEGIFVGYRYYDKKLIEPLFPFGHGLSYTSFAYGQLRLSSPKLAPGEQQLVALDLKNTGTRAGREVVQLYVRDVESSLVRPPKELKGFQKVSLEPGETKTVRFTLDPADLSFYHPGRKGWVAEPGEFEVLAGSSSRDIRAAASFFLED